MAKKSNLIKSKSIYSIKKHHASTNNGVIYENDHITILPNDGIYDDGVTLFSESNFKYKVNTETNSKKRHIRSNFVTTEDGSEEWTLTNIGEGVLSDESTIVTKPNYSSLKDFAYYGSAVELIKATMNDIILRYPGGLSYYNNNIAPTINVDNEIYYLISNEFGIDCWTKIDDEMGLSSDDIKNPLRLLMASYKNYTSSSDDTSIEKPEITYYGNICLNTIIGEVTINGASFHIYMDGEGEKHLVKRGANGNGKIIWPKKKFITEFWASLDDFEKILLNKDTIPLYKSTFETPYNNENGFYYINKSYIWPTVDGETPDLTTAAFQGYLESLLSLATFHDEYDSDNIWRMMTHESIKNLDWTFSFDKNGVEDDDGGFDTKGISAMMRIYGRQFDDIKRKADNIKASNSITYDEKNNIPDYFLTDIVDINGWEANNVAPFNNEVTSLISGGSVNNTVIHTTSGKNCSYVNSAFQRRLSLSSSYLHSLKGTRRGIEAILNLFGYKKVDIITNNSKAGDFAIHEYVYTISKALPYEEASTIRAYGEYAYDNETTNLMDGYPVAIVKKDGSDDISDWYLVPWFNKYETYRNPFYFQGKGGWGKRSEKTHNLKNITGENTTVTIKGKYVKLYEETQTYMRFASNITEMLSIPQSELVQNMVCYVTDITDIREKYTPSQTDSIKLGGDWGNEISHYFILKNISLNGFCGYVSNDLYSCYGWKNVYYSDIKEQNCDGERVLYLESLLTEEKGNNPHTGYGLYDDGGEYINRYTSLFKHAFEEGLYDYLKDDPSATDIYAKVSGGYGFNTMIEHKDNNKCAYFQDLSVVSNIESIGEVDNIVDWNAMKMEGELIFNPENTTENENEPYDESKANGIINVKKLTINFCTNGNSFLKDYFQNVVLKYLEEMIPSTSIFEIIFDTTAPEATAEETDITLNTYEALPAAHVLVDDNTTYWTGLSINQ